MKIWINFTSLLGLFSPNPVLVEVGVASNLEIFATYIKPDDVYMSCLFLQVLTCISSGLEVACVALVRDLVGAQSLCALSR